MRVFVAISPSDEIREKIDSELTTNTLINACTQQDYEKVSEMTSALKTS